MAVAIIGAGLAGLTCAHRLRELGYEVRLYDKGRGPGGRMSTRRADTPLGQVRFDHGAQYLTADTEAFAVQLSQWQDAGHVADWSARFVEIDSEGRVKETAQRQRLVGTPTMNSLIRALAEPFDVRWSTRITTLSGEMGKWHLAVEGDEAPLGPFEHVLLAIPAEQVEPLVVAHAPELAKTARAVVSAPSWTVMLAFDTRLETDFDAARIASGPLGWVARNASKPGRDDVETWVLQASVEWSRDHLEDDTARIVTHLTRALGEIVDVPTALYSAAHRWRYAQAEVSAGVPFQYDRTLGLGTCGDWHLGGKAEHAWLSGRALADRLS